MNGVIIFFSYLDMPARTEAIPPNPNIMYHSFGAIHHPFISQNKLATATADNIKVFLPLNPAIISFIVLLSPKVIVKG